MGGERGLNMDDDDAGRNINKKAERGNIIQISKYQETPLFIKALVDFAHGCILVITHTHSSVLFPCLLTSVFYRAGGN